MTPFRTSLTAVCALVSLTVTIPVASYSLDINAAGVRFTKPVKTYKEIQGESVVRQSLDYSCGPAAMATLLSYFFDDKVTEKEIIRYLLLTGDLAKIKARKGFSLLDLKNYCRARGYEVTGYKGDLAFFAALGVPVLVPVNIRDYDHFVVMRGVKNGRVFIADPAMGKMTLLVPRFESMWNDGIGLVIRKKSGNAGNGPLALEEREGVVKADTGHIRSSAGRDYLGHVYNRGEF